MSEAVAALLKLEQQLRRAESPAQLYYSIVNETHECVPYTQAVLLTGSDLRQLQVVAASDIPTVDYTSPFIAWLERLAKHRATHAQASAMQSLGLEDIDPALREDWQEMCPPEMLWLPLRLAAEQERPVGVLLLFRSESWPEAEQAVLTHLAGTMAHALFALERRQWFSQLPHRLRQRKFTLGAGLLIFTSLFLPVRLSALAPVEVIARDPLVIAAPLNGAVKGVEVMPNQAVKQGDLLVRFDDTELSSELEVAQQNLLVAQAELRTAQQVSFLDSRQKARLAELESRVRLQEAEQAFVRSRFDKARVLAPAPGIAVLGDPNEWQGRPVSIGERILLLADPNSIELQIMLPVRDAIALGDDAAVTVFFDHDPLNAWPAVVQHAEYQPQLTPDDLLAYRLIASLEGRPVKAATPRIGTRGTARVYGDSVSLFFYLFRRPITSLRQWLGW